MKIEQLRSGEDTTLARLELRGRRGDRKVPTRNISLSLCARLLFVIYSQNLAMEFNVLELSRGVILLEKSNILIIKDIQ
jgi:hypothetical protein